MKQVHNKKAKKELKAKKNTRFGGVVDKLSYTRILTYIFALIFVFAILFWVIDHFFPGYGTCSSGSKSFFDYLYFSVITFSTLGYGDINPCGVGKLLAVIEVLSGMFLFAIFIGKISSERQSTKLTLIYSSINHRRILEYIDDLKQLKDNLDRFYILHDNSKLLEETRIAYDFVSVIRKYLTLQSLEGELTEYGNDSTLRRLYQTIYEVQKKLGVIMRTSGIPEKAKTDCRRSIETIKDIGERMQQFHLGQEKIVALLKEIEVKSEPFSMKPTIHRTEIIPELLEIVSGYRIKYGDLAGNCKKIAEELGMTYSLCQRCIDEIEHRKG